MMQNCISFVNYISSVYQILAPDDSIWWTEYDEAGACRLPVAWGLC